MIHTIALFLLPGFQMLDLAALTVFDAANGEPGGTFYDTAIVSRQGGAVRGAAGADVDTRAWQAGRRCDTLLVVGGNSTFVESGTAALLHAAAGAAAASAASAPAPTCWPGRGCWTAAGSRCTPRTRRGCRQPTPPCTWTPSACIPTTASTGRRPA